MTHQPQIQPRAAQPYAGIPATVTMDTISAAVDSGFPELFGWLASQDIAPAGPAGSYLVLRHTGPNDGLVASHAELRRWAAEHGVRFGTRETGQGSAWGGRVEHYLTDPSQEPDPAKWETDVAYLTS